METNDRSLMRVAPASLLPSAGDFQTMLTMAETLFAGGLLPSAITSKEAAFTVIQKGLELRVPPMAALAGIYVIEGKPSCAAEFMAALIYRDHGDAALTFAETSNTVCTIAYRRAGGQIGQYTFALEDAKRAELLTGKNAHSWRKYPAAMLRARCISAVARFAFPDSIHGMYTPEELGAVVDVEGHVVERGEGAPRETPALAAEQTVDAEFREASEPAAPADKRAALYTHAENAGVPRVSLEGQALHAFGADAAPETWTLAQVRDLWAWVNDQVKQRRAAEEARKGKTKPAGASPAPAPSEPATSYTSDADMAEFDAIDEEPANA